MNLPMSVINYHRYKIKLKIRRKIDREMLQQRELMRIQVTEKAISGDRSALSTVAYSVVLFQGGNHCMTAMTIFTYLS